MAGPLDGYTPSSSGPLAGYTPSGASAKGAPTPDNSNSWTSFFTSPTFANESYAQEAKDIGLSAADYLTLNQLKHLAPDSVGDAIAQAHQNLGLADYGVGAASYLMPGIGPAKYLKAGTEALGMSGLGVGLGGMAAEGALAGGISATDPLHPSLMDTATGAGLGAGLGAVAHGVGKVAGTLASPLGPQVDPAAAVATTKAMRDQAYAPLKNIAFDPNDVLGAHTSATLTPGMAADISPGFNTMLKQQQKAIMNGGNTANDIADYVTNLRSAGGSPSATNGDKLLAGQTASNLEGLLGSAKPITGQAPGEALQTLQTPDRSISSTCRPRRCSSTPAT